MKRIKILRIIARLNIGGPAINTVILTEGLDKTKFDSLLVYGSVSKNEGDMSYYASQKHIKLIFIPELKRELSFFCDLQAFKKIYNIIKIEQPDIIHTHTAKAGTLGRLAGISYNLLHLLKKKQIKFIHTFHGHIFEGYFNKVQTRVFIFIERFLAVFSSRIITVSDSVKNELLALHICRKDKIEVIPLGLELDKFLEIPIRDNIVSNIGIVGRLVPIKNHRLFLETIALVIASNPMTQLKFKIIGDGELKKDLEAYACRLNVNSRVAFLGWQRDLVNVYNGLDIVVLTSLNEGTPVSLIEAMASGKTVVATDAGGVKDLLGDNAHLADNSKDNFGVLERGILVKLPDPITFAAALTFISQDHALRRDIGIRARDFVKTKFARERLIRDTQNLYDSLFA
ncbi:MAG: glycosyltransferase [Candidatus Omnitrophica bacterium]|nr:glycosyltransferase [Candidatus Omnitrophota bacterium]MDD5591845.1 glycosyltransferase [Candidatus Omnitrophota bacterium]